MPFFNEDNFDESLFTAFEEDKRKTYRVGLRAQVFKNLERFGAQRSYRVNQREIIDDLGLKSKKGMCAIFSMDWLRRRFYGKSNFNSPKYRQDEPLMGCWSQDWGKHQSWVKAMSKIDNLFAIGNEVQPRREGGLGELARHADRMKEKRAIEKNKDVQKTGFSYMHIHANLPLLLNTRNRHFLAMRDAVEDKLFQSIRRLQSEDIVHEANKSPRRGIYLSFICTDYTAEVGHGVAVDCGEQELAFFDPNLGEFTWKPGSELSLADFVASVWLTIYSKMREIRPCSVWLA